MPDPFAKFRAEVFFTARELALYPLCAGMVALAASLGIFNALCRL